MLYAHALLCVMKVFLFIHLNLLLDIDGFQLSVLTTDIQVISGENPHGEIGVTEVDVSASADITDTGHGVTFTIEIGGGK